MYIRKLVLPTLCIAVMSACNNQTQKTSSDAGVQATNVGADKDDHGCIPSAGQTWSDLKKECIQVFNIGFRLNPVNHNSGETIISAFVLMAEDQSQVEIFLPEMEHPRSIILKKIGDKQYKNEAYEYDSNKSELHIKGKLVYKGDVE